MNVKLIGIILCAGILSSCATAGGPHNSITQQADQSQLNLAFDTAKDGVTQTWTSDGAQYHLRTSDTHVNYQGVPCRNFNLDINKSFYASKTLSGTACRYEDKWTDRQNNA